MPISLNLSPNFDKDLKERLKKIPFFLFVYWWIQVTKQFFRFRLWGFIKSWLWFFQDWRKYKKLDKNEHFQASLQPELLDKTELTPLEPIYFYQDNWLASKISQNQPQEHFDVGSKAMTIALISQFVPTTMIDIRPLPYSIPSLKFQKGSILELPFDDNSIASLSSICVIEHIGLGRYGDPLDTWGSEKSFEEMKRVLVIGGNFYFTVPVDAECKYFFNAHRTFTRDYIVALMQDFELKEEKYLYGSTLQDSFQAEKGFGTGFFWFQKN